MPCGDEHHDQKSIYILVSFHIYICMYLFLLVYIYDIWFIEVMHCMYGAYVYCL